jgi:hypothetical protein
VFLLPKTVKRILVDPETRQGICMVVYIARRSELQVEIPVGGIPQRLIEATDPEIRIPSNGRRRDANKILNEQPLVPQLRRYGSVAGR